MSTSSISRANRGRVLAELVYSLGVSRAELAARTGLSVATVSRAVAALDAAGLVTQGAEERTLGRPITLVRLADRAAGTLVMDVADHHTAIAAISLSGTLLWQETIPVDPEVRGAARLDHSLEMVDRGVACWPEGTRMLGIGVSVPGPVDEDGTVDFAPAVEWKRVRLGPLIHERTGVPVSVQNDANLIAVAESEFGRARERRALFALAVFDGIGSGIVVDGTLLEGADGASGQIGRMLFTPDSIQNVYPGFGDMESRLGTPAVRERAAAAGVEIDPSADVWREVLVDRPRLDPVAKEFASDVLDEFAYALTNVCALVNPDTVVLAGYFAPIADHVGPELHRRLTGRVLHVPEFIAESTTIRGTLLGAALGAQRAYGPLEQLLD